MVKQLSTQTKTILFSILLCIVWVKPVSAADWLYSIRPGDTLWSICQQYAKEPGCWQKLGPLNNIDRNRSIPPGTRIRMPATWLKVPAASAIIVFTQGDVTYQHLGEVETIAKKGVKLPIGSQLITEQGTVTIVFADGSSMSLEPGSHLELDTLSSFELNGMVDSTVRLKRGTVKTRVIKRKPRSQFRTITPSAVASVRGTEYRVNVVTEISNAKEGRGEISTNKATTNKESTNKKSTLIEVYEGLVDVGAERKTFAVPASFGIVTEQGQAPQPPVRLLDQPLFINVAEQQTLVTVIPALQTSATSKHLPIVITWQAIDTVSHYQFNILTDLNKNEHAEQLLQTYRVNDNKVSLTNLAVGCYQLSLRAIDTLGLHGLAARKRLCLVEQLNTPVFKIPSVVNGSGEKANLDWSEVNDALTYRIEASENSDFSTLIESIELSDTRYSLEHDSPLFFRVQAIDKNGTASNFSPPTHWQPEKKIDLVPETEYWPVYVQIGLFLLALL
jgi:hypothetical protein